MKKRISRTAISNFRDAILTSIEDAKEVMSLRQAKDFLNDLLEDIQNMCHGVDDSISSIRADTECTCGQRGRAGRLHTTTCAKMKAVK